MTYLVRCAARWGWRASFLTLLLLPAAAFAAGASAANIASSVVKVFATVRYPNPYKPWTKQTPRDISGSGVVISGDRILTNAHVVLYASDIEVQATTAGDKIPATIEAIAPGIDLAVLK
ncbi:MAG: trypsin-like peptidase domain-containing protein, partial [Acetobacteraceae bacterium]